MNQNNTFRILGKSEREESKGGREGGRHLGSALANDDGAGLGDLVAVNLDSEALALRVAAVLGAARPLLVGVLYGQRAAPGQRHHRGGTRAERITTTSSEER